MSRIFELHFCFIVSKWCLKVGSRSGSRVIPRTVGWFDFMIWVLFIVSWRFEYSG